jgi:hypothetical protein
MPAGPAPGAVSATGPVFGAHAREAVRRPDDMMLTGISEIETDWRMRADPAAGSESKGENSEQSGRASLEEHRRCRDMGCPLTQYLGGPLEPRPDRARMVGRIG